MLHVGLHTHTHTHTHAYVLGSPRAVTGTVMHAPHTHHNCNGVDRCPLLSSVGLIIRVLEMHTLLYQGGLQLYHTAYSHSMTRKLEGTKKEELFFSWCRWVGGEWGGTK